MPEALSAVAAALFATFLALGLPRVRRLFKRFDSAGRALRGHAIPVARLFTRSGKGFFLTIVLCVLAALFLLVRLPVWIVAAIAASQLLSQGVIEIFKRLYDRARPRQRLAGRDPGASYPSGHASTAVVFYGGWGLVVAFSSFAPPLKASLVALLLLWGIGVAWSRLALGAHYLTDVLGGLFFGLGWLSAVVALVAHYPR